MSENTEKHPKELLVLALCGMAMRFSFWGVGNLLVLYLIEDYRFSVDTSTHIYGLFTGFSAFLPLLGGYIADRWNYHHPLFFSAIASAIGCFLIALKIPLLLYIALGLIALGFGIFIPSIFAILSYTYRNKKKLREAGFSLYYSSFNIGVFVALISMGYIANKIGWSAAFILAGIVQLLWLIPTIWYYKRYHLTYEDLHPKDRKITKETIPAAIKAHERDRIIVIILLSIISIFFWSAYNQGWSSMSIFALNYTNKIIGNFNLPTAWLLSLESLFLIILAPILAKFYGFLQKNHKDPSPITKTAFGLFFIGLCFLIMVFASLSIPMHAQKAFVSPWFMVHAYFFMAVGEMLMGPIGLSLVSQLSPHRYIGLLVGFWYVCSGIAYYLAGVMASYIDSVRYIHNFFFIFIFWTIVPGLILLAFRKKLSHMRHMDQL